MTEEKKPRDPYELELATMRQCRRLIMRLPAEARPRAIAYLMSATHEGPAKDEPKQTEIF